MRQPSYPGSGIRSDRILENLVVKPMNELATMLSPADGIVAGWLKQGKEASRVGVWLPCPTGPPTAVYFSFRRSLAVLRKAPYPPGNYLCELFPTGLAV